MSGYLSVLNAKGRASIVLTGQATCAFRKKMAARLLSEHPEVDGVL
jgi:hypothetical protein